ncbi:MAG: FG-GAP-like repeat-containing protein [Pyrinomonadaceae bacterium]
MPQRLSDSRGSLRLIIAVEGDLTPQADRDGLGLRLVDVQGVPVLNYETLKVWDASGREIIARLTTKDHAVIFDIDDSVAQYPLVIDPTFSAAAKLLANDGAATDAFGSSVAIAGDTVVVGAPFDSVGGNNVQGSAYVFVRGVNGLWSQQTKLTASDGASSDDFGRSVAISGDTVIVGAPRDDIGGNTNQGSAYVYVRNGTTWTFEDKIQAGDGGQTDGFGSSVSISVDNVIVGSSDATIGGDFGRGSAYIFVRNGGTWAQQQKLTPTDGAGSDHFGVSVSIGGSSAIIGSLSDDIGSELNQGSAYVFTRSGTTWTQQQKLTADDGAAGDEFGASVDLANAVDSVVIGSPSDDIGGVQGRGSAYVFLRSGNTWTQQQKLTSGGGDEFDAFGVSVAMFSNTAIIGTVGADNQRGSAYVFTRNGTTWTRRQRLILYDGVGGDQFGGSVALNTNTAVVGTSGDDIGGNSNQGSAQVFRLGSKPFDFDDDGKADISVFRPATGAWYRLDSSAGQFVAVTFGQNGDIPAAGDYDGDGKTDIAVFRPSNGTWYFLNSTTGFKATQFGQTGDLPVPSDADGDGKSDIRVFRPSNGTWYGLNSSTGQFVASQFGATGDLPVGGNYDGDSFSDLAVFRPSTGSWYLLETTGGFVGVQFGANGDRPVAGDFDGDGRSDIAVFRPSAGAWYRYDSSTGQFVAIGWGQNGDIPAPGDFDGDGKTDLAVFRPATGAWYLLNGAGFTAVSFGQSGDIPVPTQP